MKPHPTCKVCGGRLYKSFYLTRFGGQKSIGLYCPKCPRVVEKRKDRNTGKLISRELRSESQSGDML